MTIEIVYYDESCDETVSVVDKNFADLLEAVRYYESKKLTVLQARSIVKQKKLT